MLSVNPPALSTMRSSGAAPGFRHGVGLAGGTEEAHLDTHRERARRKRRRKSARRVGHERADDGALRVDDSDARTDERGAALIDDSAGDIWRRLNLGLNRGRNGERQDEERDPGYEATQERMNHRSLRGQRRTHGGQSGGARVQTERRARHAFCRRRKSTAESLGRSPGLEGANSVVRDSLAASPSPAARPSGCLKRRPSLTVAGPRRIFTGLPRYALLGTQGRRRS